MDFSSHVSDSKHESIVMAFDATNSPLVLRNLGGGGNNQANNSRVDESMS